MPAAGASSLYIPLAARALVSRNGVSASIRASMRPRTNILPRSLWRRTTASPPPFFTASSFARISSTSRCIASRFDCASVLTSLFTNIVDDVTDDFVSRNAGLEHFRDALGFQLNDICVRNDSAGQHHDIVQPGFFHLLQNP